MLNTFDAAGRTENKFHKRELHVLINQRLIEKYLIINLFMTYCINEFLMIGISIEFCNTSLLSYLVVLKVLSNY